MESKHARTIAEEMVVALDRAAWMVGTAEGRIDGIGYVQIDRVGRRRQYLLNGGKATARAIYSCARKQS